MTKPLFRRFVQVGRVAYVNFGPNSGSLVAIVDVVDQNRALVEGPKVTRHSVPLKWLSLTDYKVGITRSQRTAGVTKAWAAAEVEKKWSESSWGKKLAAKTQRKSLNDFDRYKLAKLRSKRNNTVRASLNKLRSAHNKQAVAAKKFSDVVPKLPVPLV